MEDVLVPHVLYCYPVGTIPAQLIVVWEFVATIYGYEEIGMKCAVINLT